MEKIKNEENYHLGKLNRQGIMWASLPIIGIYYQHKHNL